MKILVSVGTRPNFIKVTRFKSVAQDLGLDVQIVHTGQHYDENMAKVFFDQFDLRPDRFIMLQSKGPSAQIGEMVMGLSDLIGEIKPDVILTPGDVNSTLAAGIAANKTGVPLAHLESGLRSNDRSMPEEINRILVDEISDHLFVTEQSGLDNLSGIHKSAERVHFVGNTMIDTLVAFQPQIQASPILKDLKLEEGRYVLMTMHRPATVDNREGLQLILDMLSMCAPKQVVFPMHPRTMARFEALGLKSALLECKNLTLTGPLGYFGFQRLVESASFILTDSGGIQEESTFKQVPCITVRPNTERPITCEIGTNVLVKSDVAEIQKAMATIDISSAQIPPLWDGHATERVLGTFA